MKHGICLLAIIYPKINKDSEKVRMESRICRNHARGLLVMGLERKNYFGEWYYTYPTLKSLYVAKNGLLEHIVQFCALIGDYI